MIEDWKKLNTLQKILHILLLGLSIGIFMSKLILYNGV
jgi:hypothetical protein